MYADVISFHDVTTVSVWGQRPLVGFWNYELYLRVIWNTKQSKLNSFRLKSSVFRASFVFCILRTVLFFVMQNASTNIWRIHSKYAKQTQKNMLTVKDATQ